MVAVAAVVALTADVEADSVVFLTAEAQGFPVFHHTAFRPANANITFSQIAANMRASISSSCASSCWPPIR
jgi:hypothetical protein